MQKTITVETNGPGLYEFTEAVLGFTETSGIDTGLLTLFVRHTSCSLVVQENADPDVRRDLQAFFARLVPRGLGAPLRSARERSTVARAAAWG